MIKQHLDTLFSQDMTRKEFLQYIGGALLVAFGVTNLIKSLLENNTKNANVSALDYGGSAYGGVKKSSL